MVSLFARKSSRRDRRKSQPVRTLERDHRRPYSEAKNWLDGEPVATQGANRRNQKLLRMIPGGGESRPTSAASPKTNRSTTVNRSAGSLRPLIANTKSRQA